MHLSYFTITTKIFQLQNLKSASNIIQTTTFFNVSSLPQITRYSMWQSKLEVKRYTPPICHACIPQGVKQLIKQLIHPIRILLDLLLILLTNPDLGFHVTAKSLKYVHFHRKNCIVKGVVSLMTRNINFLSSWMQFHFKIVSVKVRRN